MLFKLPALFDCLVAGSIHRYLYQPNRQIPEAIPHIFFGISSHGPLCHAFGHTIPVPV